MKLNYLVISLIVFITAFFGSLITNKGMEWYNQLNLPAFTPSGSVIGMVWTIIFILVAISVMIIYNKIDHGSKIFWLIISLLILNAIFNVLWSYLFFGLSNIFGAFIEMIFLEISILAIIVLVWPYTKIAAMLLVPYAGWVIFATYLTYNVWQLNK